MKQNFNYLSKSIHVDNDVSHLLSSEEALRKENIKNVACVDMKLCKLKEEEPLIGRNKTKFQRKMRERQHKELQTVNRCVDCRECILQELIVGRQ